MPRKHSYDDSFLKNSGYQITGTTFEQRIDVLRNSCIPTFGAREVIVKIGGFMIPRVGNQESIRKYLYALEQWRRDIDWIVQAYGEDDPWLKEYKTELIGELEKSGYGWDGKIKKASRYRVRIKL